MGLNRALGSPYQTEKVSADFVTDFGVDEYIVEAVPTVVTLDPYAVDHDRVLIQDGTWSASASTPIVINASEGQTIIGRGASMTLTIAGGSVELTFRDGSWIIGITGSGLAGASGVAGSAGTVGATGAGNSAGATGTTGATGATGPAGVGTVGSAGLPGATGATGASGGTVGVQGQSGTAGSVGATGPTGVTGATGALGNTQLVLSDQVEGGFSNPPIGVATSAFGSAISITLSAPAFIVLVANVGSIAALAAGPTVNLLVDNSVVDSATLVLQGGGTFDCAPLQYRTPTPLSAGTHTVDIQAIAGSANTSGYATLQYMVCTT